MPERISACGMRSCYSLVAPIIEKFKPFYATCHSAQILSLKLEGSSFSTETDLGVAIVCGLPFVRDEEMPITQIHFFDKHARCLCVLEALAIPTLFANLNREKVECLKS